MSVVGKLRRSASTDLGHRQEPFPDDRFHRPVEGEEGHEVLDDEKTKKDLSSLAQIVSTSRLRFPSIVLELMEDVRTDNPIHTIYRAARIRSHSIPPEIPQRFPCTFLPLPLDSGEALWSICRSVRNRLAQLPPPRARCGAQIRDGKCRLER